MIVLGVDPGKHGAIARLEDVLQQTEVRAIPTFAAGKNGREQYDVQALCNLFRFEARDGIHAYVEKQQPLPPKMGGSIASFGRGYGLALFEMLFAWAQIPYTLVSPRTWQKEMHAGTPEGDTKQRSIIAAQRLFPGVSLLRTPKCRKPDDGFADALLLALYGLRLQSRKEGVA